MCKLLRDAPVEILEIGSGNPVWRIHFRRPQMRFEFNVEGGIVSRAQVRQRLWILCREGFAEWVERFKCDNPWRDTRAEILRQKWTERLIFPRLNVACAPIIHQHQTKYVIDSAFDRDRLAQRISGTDQERRFQFVIKAAGRTE